MHFKLPAAKRRRSGSLASHLSGYITQNCHKPTSCKYWMYLVIWVTLVVHQYPHRLLDSRGLSTNREPKVEHTKIQKKCNVGNILQTVVYWTPMYFDIWWLHLSPIFDQFDGLTAQLFYSLFAIHPFLN